MQTTETNTPLKRTRKPKSEHGQLTLSKKKLRQVLGYLTYYSGGLLDFTQAALMVVNADVLHRVMGKPPIVVEAKNLFDYDAIEKVVQEMVKIGRTGDVKSDIRFAVVEPDFLAVKTMPEYFFTDPFQESEKEALNRTIYGFSSNSLEEEVIGEIQLIISYLRLHYGQKQPLKAWEGFDPEVEKAVAQTLMSERTACLPQYDHLLVQPGEQSAEN